MWGARAGVGEGLHLLGEIDEEAGCFVVCVGEGAIAGSAGCGRWRAGWGYALLLPWSVVCAAILDVCLVERFGR